MTPLPEHLGSPPDWSVPPVRPAPLSLAVDRRWSTRWSTAWRLTERCFAVIRMQPGLLAVPVITTLVILVELVVCLLVAAHLPSVLAFVWVIAALVAATTVAVTGQAVIVHRVGTTMRGVPVRGNVQSFEAIKPMLVELTKWSAMTFAVGAIARMLRGRGPIGWVLRIVSTALLVAWSAMTFFVVPVMVFEGLGAREAIRRSRAIVRDNWGEGVIGVGLLNVVFLAAGLVVFALCILLTWAGAPLLALVVFVLAVVASNLLSSVASPVFSVLLYQFAVSRELAFGFDAEDLAFAFRRRRSVSV